MKKIILFVAVAMAAMACNKNQGVSISLPESEIGFSAVMGKGTKVSYGSYATGAVFFGTTYNELHGVASPTTAPRTMQVSAYLYPQNGTAGDYFVNKTFARADADGLWHSDPKVYWPISGSLDFLAYSVTIPFAADAVEWNSKNAASSVSFNVSSSYKQDDILFASVSERSSATGSTAVPMEFKHAQAWIEFRVCASPGNVVMLNDITLENVYDSGDLTITGNSGDAQYAWNFRDYESKDMIADDTYDVYSYNNTVDSKKYIIADDGNAGTDTDWEYIDLLLPEQPKTAFVLHYELKGNTEGTEAGKPGQQLSYRFDLKNQTWIAGKKYVYDITMKTNEITVDPSVCEWGSGIVTDLNGEIE